MKKRIFLANFFLLLSMFFAAITPSLALAANEMCCVGSSGNCADVPESAPVNYTCPENTPKMEMQSCASLEACKSNNNQNANTGNSSTTSSTNTFTYVPMEKIPMFEDQPTDFPHYLMSVYNFFLWTIGIAAVLMITIGAYMYIASAGNASMMTKAKGIIFDAIAGLLLALASWVLLYEINPDLVVFNPLGIFGGGGTGTGTGTGGGTGGGGGGTGANCEDPVLMKQRISSGGNVCGTTSCTSSNSSCRNNIQKYNDIIARNTASAQEAKFVKAIICRESGGNANAKASDGGCGLMQVTDGTCPMDPEANIKKGVQILRSKIAANGNSSYGGGITKEMMALSAYNCCANGDNPNSQSASCKTSDGWPSIPKWACPIDPGSGQFNMCFNKNYACDVYACAQTF